MDRSKIELDTEDTIACILSTHGVLTKYHIDDSRYLAKELMPYIRKQKREVAKEILDEILAEIQYMGINDGRCFISETFFRHLYKKYFKELKKEMGCE